MAKKINPEVVKLEKKIDYFKIKRNEIQKEINKIYYAIKKLEKNKL